MSSDAGLIAGRLERLPPTSGFWRRITLLSLGGFFEFYDLFLAAYVAPGLVKSGILTTTTPGLFGTTGIAGFVAAFFFGLFVGTALFGFVADRLGRRVIFMGSLAWYAAASLVMAFQQDAFSLNLWRFICGIGIGIELVTIDTYIAELAPPAWRGRAFAYANIIQFAAIPLVAFLGWLLVPRVIFGLDGWRFVVMAGSAGALLVWFVRRRLPESPRWLAAHGRAAEADAIVEAWEVEARLEGAELAEPRAQTGEQKRGSFGEIWRPPYLGRTVMLIVFNLFQAAGYYGFASWVPTLLIASGIEVTRSLAYTFIIAIAAPFGPAIGPALYRPHRAQMDRGGRGAGDRGGRSCLHPGAWHGGCDRLRRGADPGQQHPVLRLSRLSAGAVSHPRAGAGGGLRLFLLAALHHVQRLCHRRHSQELRRAGGVCLHRRLHGGGGGGDRDFRAQDQGPAAGENLALNWLAVAPGLEAVRLLAEACGQHGFVSGHGCR